MSTPKESSRRAARIALRLHRRTQDHLSTSYRESAGKSSAGKLSWEDFPDELWPSDDWVVGADIDPALLPELWTFLAEDKTDPPESSVLSLPPPRAEGGG
jgi:hypothetical protein